MRLAPAPSRSGRGRRLGCACLVLCLSSGLVLALLTLANLAPLPRQLPGVDAARAAGPRPVLGDDGRVLTRRYGGRWNVDDRVPLSEIPVIVQEAFLAAEDRRFHVHGGVDWRARLRAAWQNLVAGRRVSGASTIAEQVVRMLHPRPRHVWARWLEGFDAQRAQRRYGKNALLEFYLNQVPYAARRRGVVQAARWIFDRQLDTLSVRESIALAVMVRAPSRLDPRRNPRQLDWRVRAVWEQLHRAGHLPAPPPSPPGARWQTRHPRLAVDAGHFVRFVRDRHAQAASGEGPLRSTLSPALQRQVSSLLRGRVAALWNRGVTHAAALVAEHGTGRIRAWTVVARTPGEDTDIDMVRSPRQPGSTLKPFVYALALEQGFSPASRLSDSPLSERVGRGLHVYRNYSRRHYGQVSLRQALGSSLNLPAVRALRSVGPARMLQRLRALGVRSLDAHPQQYGDGLALGNGAVSVFELVQAYAGLANRGRAVALCAVLERCAGAGGAVFSPEVSSLIADILADPDARSLEFGRGGVLDFPVPTAVKTGTSSDHRDAWAVGFDHAHVAGIWMGNLDQRPMDGVSGASGPALALRAVFAALKREHEPRPLYLSPRLRRVTVCGDRGQRDGAPCAGRRQEWFIPGVTGSARPAAAAPGIHLARIVVPGPGLRVAVDPRVPVEAQGLRLRLAAPFPVRSVEWHLDGRLLARTAAQDVLWTLRAGEHRLWARVHRPDDSAILSTEPVPFTVLGPGPPAMAAQKTPVVGETTSTGAEASRPWRGLPHRDRSWPDPGSAPFTAEVRP